MSLFDAQLYVLRDRRAAGIEYLELNCLVRNVLCSAMESLKASHLCPSIPSDSELQEDRGCAASPVGGGQGSTVGAVTQTTISTSIPV